MAYGQTGSGKTHTILGPSDADGGLNQSEEMLGVLPRTLRYMFSEIQSREAQENVHYSCFVSFMEIYNERIKDLLNPGNEKKLNILFPFIDNPSPHPSAKYRLQRTTASPWRI